jgi:hypothetical protein
MFKRSKRTHDDARSAEADESVQKVDGASDSDGDDDPVDAVMHSIIDDLELNMPLWLSPHGIGPVKVIESFKNHCLQLTRSCQKKQNKLPRLAEGESETKTDRTQPTAAPRSGERALPPFHLRLPSAAAAAAASAVNPPPPTPKHSAQAPCQISSVPMDYTQ